MSNNSKGQVVDALIGIVLLVIIVGVARNYWPSPERVQVKDLVSHHLKICRDLADDTIMASRLGSTDVKSIESFKILLRPFEDPSFPFPTTSLFSGTTAYRNDMMNAAGAALKNIEIQCGVKMLGQ